MFKKALHSLSFILNSIALPRQIVHSRLSHGAAGATASAFIGWGRKMPCLSLLLPNTVLNARCSRRIFTYSCSFWTVLLLPHPIFHGRLHHGVGGGDGPLPLLNEVREILMLPLPAIPFWTIVFQAGTSLTSLMFYQNSADIQWCLHHRGIGDLPLSLQGRIQRILLGGGELWQARERKPIWGSGGLPTVGSSSN